MVTRTLKIIKMEQNISNNFILSNHLSSQRIKEKYPEIPEQLIKNNQRIIK